MAEQKRQSRERLNAKITPEERKAKERAYYEANKDRFKAKAKKWQAANREHQQAMSHQAQVKVKYPEAFAGTDITNDGLHLWILERRHEPCLYCGTPESDSIDHKVPLSKGGSHTYDNLHMICKQCNTVKAKYTHDEYVDWIRRSYERIFTANEPI